MEMTTRNVESLPLTELWNDNGPLEAQRVRECTKEDIEALLQRGAVRFVVATLKFPLIWNDLEGSGSFWEREASASIYQEAHPEPAYYPDGYYYKPSAWVVTATGEPIILLEMSA